MRSDDLIRALGLQPHPEGGFFSEIYRSAALVSPADARGPRAALTSIYFLLARGQRSRLHRVASDEAWHFCEGDPLELTVVDPAFAAAERVILGPVDARPTRRGRRFLREGTEGSGARDGARCRPVHVVPRGMWQAARPLGVHALVGCTVAPGFDFADFSMLDVRTRPIAVEDIRRLRSAWLRPSEHPDDLVYPGDDDPHALHLGAFQDDALLGITTVAPGRLEGVQDSTAWQMRGVAVHPDARGEGIGHRLMAHAIEHVAAHGGTLLWCNARVTAQRFYRQLGFERLGESFDVPGVGPHYVMKRRI